jgi:hypothetical protein
MAIKITGMYPLNGTYAKDPVLSLVPHLTYANNLTLDVFVNNQDSETKELSQIGCVGYNSIDINSLDYPEDEPNGYTNLIMALNEYVVNDIKTKYPELTVTII